MWCDNSAHIFWQMLFHNLGICEAFLQCVIVNVFLSHRRVQTFYPILRTGRSPDHFCDHCWEDSQSEKRQNLRPGAEIFRGRASYFSSWKFIRRGQVFFRPSGGGGPRGAVQFEILTPARHYLWHPWHKFCRFPHGRSACMGRWFGCLI